MPENRKMTPLRVEEHRCIFCDRTQDQCGDMIGNEDGSICRECWERCGEIFQQITEDSKSQKTAKSYKPSEIYKVLDQYVIGQENAKKHLAVAVSNHCKLMNDTTGEIRKQNIMMVGPTGCGKTLLAKTLAKYLDVPMIIVNSPDYTQNGYVGGDINNILLMLLKEAKNDLKAAEQGIIFFDEIDKTARKGGSISETRDPAGEGLQQGLLKIIEGGVVQLQVSMQRGSQLVNFDTSKVLCICGGAFEGIKEAKKKKKAAPIGFGTAAAPQESDDRITQDDLISYGMLPELLGRTPILVELEELSEEELVRVLTEPKDAVINSYRQIFLADNKYLSFAPETLRQFAKEAKKRKTGARGLESMLEERLLPLMYEAPDDHTYNFYYVQPDQIEKRHMEPERTTRRRKNAKNTVRDKTVAYV